MRGPFLSLLTGLALAGTGASACTEATPCALGDRAYFVALPETADAPLPAVIYMHGWGGSGVGALRNRAMVEGFLDRGYAVIAPDGVPRQGRSGRTWAFYPESGRQEAEIDFLQAVREDATERFNLAPDRILLAGFSIGGSMAAYAACLAPESFAAYAPLGGSFWRPHPQGCAGPVRLLHTHGWADGVVPLEGRVVNGVPNDTPDAFAQGDIFHAMQLWREANECRKFKADRMQSESPFWRRDWEGCAEGSALGFALHPGGHSVPKDWPALVVDWFEGL